MAYCHYVQTQNTQHNYKAMSCTVPLVKEVIPHTAVSDWALLVEAVNVLYLVITTTKNTHTHKRAVVNACKNKKQKQEPIVNYGWVPLNIFAYL